MNIEAERNKYIADNLGKTKSMFEMIDDVFNHFGSRLCENCVALCMEGAAPYCLITKNAIPFDTDDYGCNKWEEGESKWK